MPKKTTRAKAGNLNLDGFACLEQAISPATRGAYAHDLQSFWNWASVRKLARKPRYPIPLQWVMAYVRENLAGLPAPIVKRMAELGPPPTGRPLSVTTLHRRLAALSLEHSLRGVPNPCRDSGLHLLMRRANRLKGAQSKRNHAPITADVLRRLLAVCRRGLRGSRDRALLMVGFAGGGRRRSELSALKVEDLEKVRHGYVVRLSYHKTQHVTAEALTFPILGEAAKALDRWLAAAKIRSGPVFRGIHRDGCILGAMHPGTVHRIVQRLAVEAGYPSTMFGAHSLRSGFITQAAREGIALAEAMSISGHRSLKVAFRYYRQGGVLKNRAALLLAG